MKLLEAYTKTHFFVTKARRHGGKDFNSLTFYDGLCPRVLVARLFDYVSSKNIVRPENCLTQSPAPRNAL